MSEGPEETTEQVYFHLGVQETKATSSKLKTMADGGGGRGSAVLSKSEVRKPAGLTGQAGLRGSLE